MRKARRDAAAVRLAALAYLQQCHVMSLATYGPLGLWAAAVFYVADEQFQFTFLSAAHTRHAQNIAASPQAAATIQQDYDTWQAVQGIQLEGTVRPLAGPDAALALASFAARFPFLRHAPEPVRAALDKVNWYCLTPRRLYFVDNSQGFGHRDEVDLRG